MIYHCALPEDWERAQRVGLYSISSRGQRLADVGFIHFSYRHQVERVANAYYADVPVIALIEIDPTDLPVRLIDENLEGGDELFPHLYRPVDVEWARTLHDWRPGADGVFRLDDLEI